MYSAKGLVPQGFNRNLAVNLITEYLISNTSFINSKLSAGPQMSWQKMISIDY